MIGFHGELDVIAAIMIDDNTVEIVLDGDLDAQQAYTVSVISLQTEAGFVFSDSINVIYMQSGSSSEIEFDAFLRGENEIPSVSTTAMGTGTFLLTINGLEYDITLENMSSTEITGAHFHRGSASTEGSIVETIHFNGLRASGTWTDLTSEERANLLDGNIYVNVHTNAYPDGEIRGQVSVQ